MAWQIDEQRCIGCKKCMEACPFGMITIHPEGNRMLKCDLCDGQPQCVRFCETRALQFLPINRMAYEKQRNQTLREMEGQGHEWLGK